MASNLAKGNYYRIRTRKWLESQGWTVERLESVQRIVTKDKTTGEPKVLFRKRDLWGADLIAVHKPDQRTVVVQSKSNEGDIARGLKELAKHWPAGVECWVTYWPPRRRFAEGPDIHEVVGEAE